ncbi:MAG TPA: hypothetical protein PLM29_16180, partial [Deltaproteobacteria bacterium]|nr:hypothetical protein [Deltaproteobacteria bacterium]
CGKPERNRIYLYLFHTFSRIATSDKKGNMTMRSIITAICIVFILPGIVSAGRLQLEVPPGFSEVYLLSEGTSSILNHLKAKADAETAELSETHQVALLKERMDKASTLAQEKKKAYSGKFSSLRESYLKSLSVNIIGVDAEIYPSSSALAEVYFYFSVKNNSDRIVTDITYRPGIGDIILPTTSSLILEFIHPATLVYGLGPGQTLTNKGYDPEHFSFFIGQLSKEELKKIQENIKTHFSMEITDMHFTNKRGYKDQTQILGFRKAFESQLMNFQTAQEKAEADALKKKKAYDEAVNAFNHDRDALQRKLEDSLEDLKKASIRFTKSPDEDNRCVFDGIDAGNYLVYAKNAQGSALFTGITVETGNTKLTVTDLTKDPFTP